MNPNARIAALPHDERTGLPVPWTAARLPGGRPDFTTVDAKLSMHVAVHRLCGVCGQQLDPKVAFLGTLACAEYEVFHDPPMHPQCAYDSLALCPHIRRGHPVTSLATGGRREVTGWLVWITRDYEFWVDDEGRVAYHPAEPVRREHFEYRDGVLTLTTVDGTPVTAA